MKSESPVAAIYRWNNDGTCTVEPLYRESRQATIDRVRAVLAEFEDCDNDGGWWFADKLREALGDAK